MIPQKIMVNVWLSTITSVIAVSLVSLIGMFFLSIKAEKLHKLLLVLIGFATGALLGDVFIHLLPELVQESGFTLVTSFSVLTGILTFFVLEKYVQWRHCHMPTREHHTVHPLATMNLVGDAFHNFVDGMIIAGSYLVSFEIGIATTLAVLLHEIPQEIGDFAILTHAGIKRTKALLFNFLSALTAVLGAIIVLAFNIGSQNGLHLIVPFTAGGFLYIAGADLLPELHKTPYAFRSSTIQLLSIISGIAVMYALTFL